ncbi:unnamed protein product [Urochloa humidicola]
MDALLRRLLCCFGTRRHRRQGQPRQRYGCRGDSAKDDDSTAKKSFLQRATRPSGAATACGVERLETAMARPHRRRRWCPRPRVMNNRVFARSPPCRTTTSAVEPRHATAATSGVQAGGGAGDQVEFPVEHAAAITIQAHFRGHLARQAFRALRSLVKLQAFARGAYVRKQVNVAIRCMKVLVRLQVRVRSRQLLLSTPAAGAAKVNNRRQRRLI